VGEADAARLDLEALFRESFLNSDEVVEGGGEDGSDGRNEYAGRGLPHSIVNDFPRTYKYKMVRLSRETEVVRGGHTKEKSSLLKGGDGDGVWEEEKKENGITIQQKEEKGGDKVGVGKEENDQSESGSATDAASSSSQPASSMLASSPSTVSGSGASGESRAYACFEACLPALVPRLRTTELKEALDFFLNFEGRLDRCDFAGFEKGFTRQKEVGDGKEDGKFRSAKVEKDNPELTLKDFKEKFTSEIPTELETEGAMNWLWNLLMFVMVKDCEHLGFETEVECGLHRPDVVFFDKRLLKGGVYEGGAYITETGKKTVKQNIERNKEIVKAAVLVIERSVCRRRLHTLKQIIEILMYILDMNEEREFVYGCRQTTQELLFIRVERRCDFGKGKMEDEGLFTNYRIYVMPKLGSKEGGFYYLAEFLKQPAWFYGLGCFFGGIGVGMVGRVLSGDERGERVVRGRSGNITMLKDGKGDKFVSKEFRISQRLAFRNEVITLLKLRVACAFDDDGNNKDILDHLPIISGLSGADFSLLERKAGVPMCSTLGQLRIANKMKLESENEVTRNSLDAFFDNLKNMDIYRKDARETSERLVKMLVPILKVLKQMAKLNIVHRDVRSANVMVDEAGKLTLIDFGFCCPAGVRVPFAGCLACASDQVLEALTGHDGQTDLHIVFKPEYDVISFVRSVYLLLNREIQERLVEIPRLLYIKSMAKDYLRFWKDVDIFPDLIGLELTTNLDAMIWLLNACPQFILSVGYFELNKSDRDLIVKSRLFMGRRGLLLISNYLDAIVEDSDATVNTLKKMCSIFGIISTSFYPKNEEEKIKHHSLFESFDGGMSKEERLKNIKVVKEILDRTTLDDILEFLKKVGIDNLPYLLRRFIL
jgi:hypothetical protein